MFSTTPCVSSLFRCWLACLLFVHACAIGSLHQQVGLHANQNVLIVGQTVTSDNVQVTNASVEVEFLAMRRGQTFAMKRETEISVWGTTAQTNADGKFSLVSNLSNVISLTPAGCVTGWNVDAIVRGTKVIVTTSGNKIIRGEAILQMKSDVFVHQLSLFLTSTTLQTSQSAPVKNLEPVVIEQPVCAQTGYDDELFTLFCADSPFLLPGCENMLDDKTSDTCPLVSSMPFFFSGAMGVTDIVVILLTVLLKRKDAHDPIQTNNSEQAFTTIYFSPSRESIQYAVRSGICAFSFNSGGKVPNIWTYPNSRHTL